MPIPSGYDEEFVDTPPDYLKCIICCLVLRDPIQIMRCGHRYCSVCYQQIKKYSQHLNSPFICPIDREEIDLMQVFNDTGMARIIADLKVKCSFQKEGCEWSGELRNLDAHKNQCQYNVQISSPTAPDPGRDDIALQLAEMSMRMDKCEEALYEKEKEIGFMKLVLQETKDKVDERDNEVKFLKQKGVELEKEIVLLKESRCTLKEEVDSVRLHGEDKLFQLNDMVENGIKQAVEGQIKSIIANLEEVTNDMHNMKMNNSTNATVSIKTVENDLRAVQENIERIENQNAFARNGVEKSIRDLKSQWGGLQSKTDKFTNLLDNRKKLLDEMSEELRTVRTQQLCVDTFTNINSPSIKNTRFVWKINDLKEVFNARKEFASDKFYCFPHGHVCQLYFHFDSERYDMVLAVRLCRGRYSVDTALFQAQVSIECRLYNGKNKSQTVLPENIDEKRQRSFTFNDPLAEHTHGLGFGGVSFRKSEMDQFIKGEITTVICTVNPIS